MGESVGESVGDEVAGVTWVAVERVGAMGAAVGMRAERMELGGAGPKLDGLLRAWVGGGGLGRGRSS